MKYTYEAFDRDGSVVKDVIEAGSTEEATETVRRKGLYISRLAPADAGDAPSGGTRMSLGGAARLRSLTNFARQLSVLVSTGTPLVDAIGALERQTKDLRFKAIVRDVRARVEEGVSLSEAMAAHPAYFDGVCRSLISAGENSGNMDLMLGRLADLTRQQQRMRSSVVGAMVYPALLICVSCVVLGLMIGFVLPRFTGLFDTLDAPLPPTTQMLMILSTFARSWWWAMLIILALAGVGARLWSVTEGGRSLLHRFMIHAPQFGRITRNLSTARLSRLLGVLLTSKVPLLDALDLTGDGVTNVHYASMIDDAVEAVTRGEAVNSAFAASGLIDAAICEALRNGEESGQLGQVLVNIADHLDEDNETVIKSLTSIIEPLILVVLGGIVGFVAMSMFLPLFDLTAMTGSA